MTKLTTSVATIVLALGLAGCGTTASDKIAAANSTVPKGSAFEVALHKGYVQQANFEAKEYDFENAEVWSDKAIAVAGGAKVAPEALAGRSLPKDTVPDITSARARLLAALAAGAAKKAPGDVAHAQVMFDCWVEEQEENVQPDDIRACRSGFEDALAKAKAAMQPMTAAAPGLKQFIVYFDTDSDDLTAGGRYVVSLILDAARKAGAKKVVLAGHTDRVGAMTYNDMLSKRRVDSVAAALVAAGLASSVVSKSKHGETMPRVATPDDTAERQNRRVEVRVE